MNCLTLFLPRLRALGMKKTSLYLCVVCGVLSFSCSALAANQDKVDCDPIVHMDATIKTLQQVLIQLAEQHDFELIFPVDADRRVESIDSMTLSQGLKFLTTDVNTVLQHEKVDGCAKGRLIAVEVLPVGGKTEYVYVQSKGVAGTSAQAQTVYIDNMELYAEEVLLKQRKADKDLTPEQRKEFRRVMEEVRARMEADGVLESRKEKNKNKGKKDKKAQQE